jgi:iron complex transport system permease protein
MDGKGGGHAGKSGRNIFWIVLLGLASLASLFLSVLFGPMDIAPGEVLAVIGRSLGLETAREAPESWSVVVVDIRLARSLLAWPAGAALAASGVVFQGVLRNPLADPFTLGVSSGAAFGASLAIQFGLGASAAGFAGLAGIPLFALAGAMGSLAAVLALGRSVGRLRRETLVLAGIVVATFLSALISLVKSLDEESVASIVFWIMGSFQGRGWPHLAMLLPALAFGLVLVVLHLRELDILSLGETQARQLGVEAGRARLALLCGASLMAGAAVSVSGIIGFVGLVVPHLVRLFTGHESAPLLAASALAGGVLLLWSDVLAKSVLAGGAELPVGVVTAILGGPFFLFLLSRRKAGGAA